MSSLADPHRVRAAFLRSSEWFGWMKNAPTDPTVNAKARTVSDDGAAHVCNMRTSYITAHTSLYILQTVEDIS
ncbi:hypothetical protein X797_003996 [Metarhizium robertsii]|uniref:Uncharacterized protein n=1 Tax=Metarhizium robertsii TaxID=568076 RepID=A0A0A1UZU8_9HYPO|nr:hypothetical protein X797_003996 [Metarhizium robertsii]